MLLAMIFPGLKFISRRSSDVGQHRKYLRKIVILQFLSLQSFTALDSSSTILQMEITISENSTELLAATTF